MRGFWWIHGSHFTPSLWSHHQHMFFPQLELLFSAMLFFMRPIFGEYIWLLNSNIVPRLLFVVHGECVCVSFFGLNNISIAFFFCRFIFIFILLLFGKVPLFFLSFPFCFLIRVTEFYSSWLPAVMFVPVEKKISMELSSCLTMESWFWLRVRVEVETWLFIIHVNEHTRTCPFGILWKGKFFNGYFLFLGFFREECEKQ